MKAKTTMAIAALAIALAVAYATWTETATITVNAATGYIDLDFQNANINQCPAYAKCDIALGAGSAAGNDGAPSATITISNAYPGAQVVATIQAYNDGTIPVNIQCQANAPPVLTVNVSLDKTMLEPGDSAVITVTIVAGNVAEEETYSATVSCTYTQAVP